MRRLLVSVVLLAAVAGAVLIFVYKPFSDDTTPTYRAIFDNAFGLVEGGNVQVGGVTAGQTTSFSVTNTEPPKAIVEIKITQPGLGNFLSDASCEVRQQSLIGEYYVNCQPGREGKKLSIKGGTIPVEQNTSTIPVDLVQNVMRRPYRERFRLIISELGTGLAGRPQDLAETLRRAHPGFRETSKTLKILGDQSQIIQDFIVDSDTVIEELEAKKTEVSRWARETGETAEIAASRADEQRAAFRRLPPFLDELEPTMVRLGELSDEQVPTLRSLREAAPELNRFFLEAGGFAESSRPALRSLGQTAITGRSAIRESREEIRQLRLLSINAPKLATPLRQLLEDLDDRDRAYEDDPRAEETAPPGDDKTSDAEGKGFTGFENIVNYFFWQTLSLNPVDSRSHLLRTLNFLDEECTPYNPGPDTPPERCLSWLGDTQPGVTTDDPTDGDNNPDEPGEGNSEAFRRDGGARGRTPGQGTQPDLGEQLRGLMGARSRGRDAGARRRPASPRPATPAPGAPAGGPAPDQLLDYLMAP